jgi:hypothetical protein
VKVVFSGEVWFWRGPAPFHFVTVPPEHSADIRAIAVAVTYGWGMIPCEVTVGVTTFETALWPKNETYIVGLKKAVRDSESIAIDDDITVVLRIGDF